MRDEVVGSAVGAGARRWLLVAVVCAGLSIGMVVSAAGGLMWRSVVRTQERQAFESAASGVTATLETLLRRDTDFVDTLRGVLMMQPHLTATGFNMWYRTLNGSQRQVGSVGSAVVSVVSARQLRAFELRRNADPAFRALLGRWLMPVADTGQSRYCLLSEGGELIPVTSLTARLVQQDWCGSDSEVGLFEAPLLRSAGASGQVLVEAIDVPIIHVTFLEVAFYRRQAALATVAQRRAAVAGWVLSSFDMPEIVDAAIGRTRGLRVDLYHRNPGGPAELVSSGGSVARAGELTRTSNVWIDGAWTVTVRGFRVVAGIGADWQAAIVFGGGLIVTVLLVVLALSRERALRLVAQKTAELRFQALRDALTGLPNRRALIADLSAPVHADSRRELMLALFDLDGFKEYNDSFGHPSGDALLVRLGTRLARTVGGIGTAYRMGGDEFCVLAACDEQQAAAIAARAASALTETGEAFRIGCSYGIARLPHDACDPADALRIADDRMYDHKTSRVSAGRQSTDVLLRALAERDPGLSEHVCEVATLASATAERLGVSASEIKRISLAAELHDIGKVAIPDSILNKPGPLNEQEWEFMRRHTLIGERIVSAAPSLAHTAQLIRSSHEHYDGHGYPDHLSGNQIPIGASIIAVCDAFDAMTSTRPYSPAITSVQAIAELRRCATTQFHPTVVQAFCELIAQPEATATATARAA